MFLSQFSTSTDITEIYERIVNMYMNDSKASPPVVKMFGVVCCWVVGFLFFGFVLRILELEKFEVQNISVVAEMNGRVK